jgi:hydrogenase maturation protease
VTVSEQPLVVIGVGNVLLRDDAVGIRVVDRLRELVESDATALPQPVLLVDGGSLVMELLATVREARGLVLVDAVMTGDPAGTVSVRHGEAILAAGGTRAGRSADTVHELLDVARILGWLPDRVALVGVEAADIDFGMDLSPSVGASLPLAVEAVRRELLAMDAPETGTNAGRSSAPRMAGTLA